MSRLPLTFAVLLAVGVAIAAYCRLFFGVDLTDESQFVAYAHAFLRGHRPLIDEMCDTQTSGILLMPILGLYERIVDPMAGIVLYMRHIYFLVSMGCAGLSYFIFASQLAAPVNITLSAFLLGFFPLIIPSVTYNSMGSLFFFLGELLFVGTALGRVKTKLGVLGGCLLLYLAAFAYPPMLIPGSATLVCYLLWTFWHRRGEFRENLFLTGGTFGGLGLATVLGLIGYPGISRLKALLEFQRSAGVHGVGLEKFVSLYHGFEPPMKTIFALMAMIGVSFLFRGPNQKREECKNLLLFLVFLVTLRIVFPGSNQFSTSPNFMLLAIACAGILLLPFQLRCRDNELSAIILLLFIPSWIAGIFFAWASTNGWNNAPLGCLGACVAVFVSLNLHLKRSVKSVGISSASFIGALAVLQAWSIYQHVCNDDPIPLLTRRVDSGPFKGIRTSPDKARYLERVEAELKMVSKSGARSILTFDYFPAGYLMSDLRPHTPMIWMYPANQRLRTYQYNRASYLKTFETSRYPDAIVQMKVIFFSSQEQFSMDPKVSDPVREFFVKKGYTAVSESSDLIVYLAPGLR